MYDKSNTKKINFTPSHIIYGHIKTRDRGIFNRKIWQREDGRVYVYIPSGMDDVKEYLFSRYFILEITEKELRELAKEVYDGLGQNSVKGNGQNSEKGG